MCPMDGTHSCVQKKKRYSQFPPGELLEHPAGGNMCFLGGGWCQFLRGVAAILFGDKTQPFEEALSATLFDAFCSILEHFGCNPSSKTASQTVKQTDIQVPAENVSHGWHPQLCTKKRSGQIRSRYAQIATASGQMWCGSGQNLYRFWAGFGHQRPGGILILGRFWGCLAQTSKPCKSAESAQTVLLQNGHNLSRIWAESAQSGQDPSR
eukprot:gene22789-biopygen11771